MSSLMFGVPSLAFGLMSTVLIFSYMIDRPIGPPGFYTVEWFPVGASGTITDSSGQTSGPGLSPPQIGPSGFYPITWPTAGTSNTAIPTIGQIFSRALPSQQLLGMLVAGAWAGGIGTFLARRRRPRRHATTSIVGMIACGLAFLLAWALLAWAAAFW